MHALSADPYSRSLSSVLVQLAMMHLFGDPERHATIVKRCDTELDAVPLAAPLRTAGGLSCGQIELRAKDGGPAAQGELRDRCRARAARTVSEVKAEAGRGRPELGSAAPRVRAHCRLKPTLGRMQLSSCESRVPLTGDRLMICIAVTSPSTTGVGVETLTDEHSALQSPLTARTGYRYGRSHFGASTFGVALRVLGAS